MVVVLCMAITGMSNRSKTKFEWIKLAMGTLIGLGLCLLSIADLTIGGANYIYSPWLLPTVVICLCVVAVLHGVKEDSLKKAFERRGSEQSDATRVGDEFEMVERKT